MVDKEGSRLRIDGLGSNLVEAVDMEGADEVAVVEDLVLGGAGGSASGAGNRLPGEVDDVAVLGALASDDRPGDDPLEDNVVGVGASADGEPSRVLGSGRVDSIDDVGADDAGALVEFGGGEASGETESDDEQADESPHDVESKNGIHPIFKWALAAGSLIVVAVMAFAIFEPIQVLPRIRLAPGFALVDQNGGSITSEDGKGAVTLYAFTPVDCGDECETIHDTMRRVRSSVAESVDLGSADFRMVTVALNSDDPEVLSKAAADSGADGDVWRWAGANEEVLGDVVGSGFRVYFDASDPADVAFDPTFIIVDGTGLVRGEYPYATISSDADRLTRHIGILGEEILYATGNNALIYEAAHIFLCYP